MGEDFEYIKGDVIYGRNLIPTAGYLCFTNLGMMIGQLYMEISVVIESVKFICAIIIPKESIIEIIIMIQKVSVRLFENIDVIVAGSIEIYSIKDNEKKPISNPNIEEFNAYCDRKKKCKIRYNFEKCSKESWILLREINKIPKNTLSITINSNKFNLLKEIQTELANEIRVILVENSMV
ncbi:fatty acid synthase-like [Vespula maculifrons]|uniref:Fatty acid synthase-like n=1 Tax=Vespula maculifrons TaxID=7453 RepID=A0ABD2B977_VESMC